MVVFEEIPDKVTLSFSITNCCGKCKGCHSPFLRGDVGYELNEDILEQKFHNELQYVNCVLFLGEGKDLNTLIKLSHYIKNHYPHIETAIYSGRDDMDPQLFNNFDYVKIGSYQSDKGPLNNINTNQRLYYHQNDITYKFWTDKR